jgi:hypothetical protein
MDLRVDLISRYVQPVWRVPVCACAFSWHDGAIFGNYMSFVFLLAKTGLDMIFLDALRWVVGLQDCSVQLKPPGTLAAIIAWLAGFGGLPPLLP